MEYEFRAWTGSEMVYDNQDKIVKPNHLRSVDDKYFSKPRVYHNQIQVWFYESMLPHATSENYDHITYIPQTFVMQYTGLKDKNGVKIFDGDIVRVCRSYGYGFLAKGAEAVVSFSETELCYFLNGKFRLTANKQVEVIGNIYGDFRLK